MNKVVFKRLLKLLLKHKIYLFIAIILALAHVVSNLYIPIYIGHFIDNINIYSFDILFNNYILILLVLVFLSAVTIYFSTYLMNLISYKLTYNLRNECFNKLSKASISYIDSYSSGDLIIRSTLDIEQIADTLLQSLTNFITGIITIVTTLIIMLFLNYQIGLLVFFLTPLSLIFASFISKKIYKSMKAQTILRSKLSTKALDSFNLHDMIILNNYEDITYNEFLDINKELQKAGFKAQFYGALINPMTRFINALIYALIVLIGSLLCLSNKLTIGSLQVFLNYASSYTKPFNDCTQVYTEISNALACAKRIFEILDIKLEEDNKGIILEDINKIEFKNVYFKYPTSKDYVIKNLNLVINKNEMVSIVGTTGSGKTTIINLLLRFYDIDSGDILINDINIYDYNINSLRDNIALVLQDTYIFKDTIFNNINYNNTLTIEEIINYSKITKAHEFIMKTKDNYDTLVDNDSLSTGQKQLLALTRVIAKKANTIILDEATSNLDLKSEKFIKDSIDLIAANKTSIMIAHRLETILNSDKIIVFDNGQIESIGKHNELLQCSKLYKKIFLKEFQN